MEFTIYKKQSCSNECTSIREIHKTNLVASHVSHYNLILDLNYKTGISELIIKNSCNQQSNMYIICKYKECRGILSRNQNYFWYVVNYRF